MYKKKSKNIKALVTMFHGGFPENINNFYKLKKNIILISLKMHVMLDLSINIEKKKLRLAPANMQMFQLFHYIL